MRPGAAPVGRPIERRILTMRALPYGWEPLPLRLSDARVMRPARLLHMGVYAAPQIIQELAERTGGVWRPSPGSVYPTLQQLEDEELVRETASESGKRVYELTDAGREQAAGAPAPWTAVAGENESELMTLHDLAHQVLAAARQVAHAGTATQIEAAQAVLRDARKALYRLLAEDEDAS